MKIETSPGNLKFKKEPQLSRCTKSDVENNGWGWEGGGGKRKGLVLITSTGEVGGIRLSLGCMQNEDACTRSCGSWRDYVGHPMYKCLVYGGCPQ